LWTWIRGKDWGIESDCGVLVADKIERAALFLASDDVNSRSRQLQVIGEFALEVVPFSASSFPRIPAVSIIGEQI
jgi:hypothetical protein